MTKKIPANGVASNADYDFFYAGLERDELLIQQCDACGRLRNPPLPVCPWCRSPIWHAQAMSGRGEIYTYGVHHHPPLPDLATPHPYGLVALDEGVRFFAAFDGIALDRLAVGLRVRAGFVSRDGVASVRFVEDSAT